MKKYILVEEGEYSDYSVGIMELPENCDLSDEQLEKLLSFGRWKNAIIGGHITGEVSIKDNTAITIDNLKDEITQRINSEFACYPNREFTTILDKIYSKEELIKMAETNDQSGHDFWVKRIEEEYKEYLEVYDLYHQLF